MDYLHFSKNERVEENYVLAFKQITEIALKAMSPGINDPGTTINAIDYLTDLFLLRMEKRDQSYLFDDNDIPYVRIKTVNFKDLIYNVMSALRTYSKHDIIVVEKLFIMLSYLLEEVQPVDASYSKTVAQEIQILYEDALKNQSNEADLSTIKHYMRQIKLAVPSAFANS